GKGREAALLQADQPWLFLPTFALPFEESVGGHEATAADEGVAERGLVRQALRPRVDAFIPDRGIVCPGRDKAPSHGDELAPVLAIEPHHRTILRPPHVLAPPQIPNSP